MFLSLKTLYRKRTVIWPFTTQLYGLYQKQEIRKGCQENFIDKAFIPLYNSFCCLGVIIMKWSLLELNKYKEEPLVFSETLHLKEELLQRDDTLLDVSPIKVEGLLAVNKSEYLLHYTIQVTVTVPSSRSLEPVALPMQITVDEVFMTKEQMDTRDERFAAEEIILLDKPTIDLDESVEDNILLSIPIQVLTEEEQNSQEMPSGNDWEVISEEAYLESKQKAAEQTVDPRLAKLSELLSDNAEEEDNS